MTRIFRRSFQQGSYAFLLGTFVYNCVIIFLPLIKPNRLFYGIYSEGAYTVTNRKGGAPMHDEQIVALYWDRKEEAIRQTQQKYGAYLSKIAYNILSDFEDSKECVNDTYLKAWNSMPTHRPSVLSTYLGKIARQLSIDVYRNSRRIRNSLNSRLKLRQVMKRR